MSFVKVYVDISDISTEDLLFEMEDRGYNCVHVGDDQYKYEDFLEDLENVYNLASGGFEYKDVLNRMFQDYLGKTV